MSTVREHLGLLWLSRRALMTSNPQHDRAWVEQAALFVGVHLNDLIDLAGGADLEQWVRARSPEIPDDFPHSVATGAQPDQRESAAVRSREWQPVTAPGQVRKGDKLRFKIGDKEYSERAKLILHAGTDKEEVIYDKGRNFYFITAMVMSGFSNHKCVEVLAAAASPAAQPAKDEQ
jgi:hypothetical protein